jgi:hypothetical protein
VPEALPDGDADFAGLADIIAKSCPPATLTVDRQLRIAVEDVVNV